MKPLDQFTEQDWKVCNWRGTEETFHHLATSREKTQSQKVVKPIHWYIACRLVLEGGFLPEEITPRPPFVATKKKKKDQTRWLLSYDQSAATGSEANVLGGLKTKAVDVVVEKPGIGPVIAISCKNTGGAFRNLTNRMEEAVGECTNLHMTYSALVTGYFSVLRAHRRGSDPSLADNDVAIGADGTPVEGIARYHEACRQLEGRMDLRDTISKYEAVALILLETSGPNIGGLLDTFPPPESPLRVEHFFSTIYSRYDERFVFAAPIFSTRNITPRIEWDATSPLFDKTLAADREEVPELDYDFRVKVHD